MTRQERLEFCKICSKRGFSPQKGIICSLTNDIADFEELCKDYIIDDRIKGLADYKEKQEQVSKVKKKRSYEKVSADDIYLLIGITLIATFAIRFLYYINYSADLLYTQMIIFLAGMASLILREKRTRKFSFWANFKFKGLFALLITLFQLLYKVIVFDQQMNLVREIIAFFTLSFLLISLLSASVVITFRNINRLSLKFSGKNEENS